MRAPAIDTSEETEVTDVGNGVAGDAVELERTPNSLRRFPKKRVDENEEDSYDSRFKLRNGREVGVLILFPWSFSFCNFSFF